MEKKSSGKSSKSNAGRKWFDGKDEKAIIAKLEECTALDASIDECVFYADISRDSYYRYINAHPDFATRLDGLRNRPVLLARQTAIGKIKDSYQNAMDYLSRKRKAEFTPKTEVDLNASLTIGELLDRAEGKTKK